MLIKEIFQGITGILFAIFVVVFIVYKIKSCYKNRKFKKHRKKLNQLIKQITKETEKDYIKLSFEPNNNLSLFTSKIGGLPYIPRNGNIPFNEFGEPMYMLAQINCEELPKNSIYPPKGLLQFFISAGDLYGIDIGYYTSGTGHQVLYYETYDTTITEEDIKAQYSLENEIYDESPHDKNQPLKITFSAEKQAITACDYAFKNYFIKKYNDKFGANIESIFDLDDSDSEHIYQSFGDYQSQIGGYPMFIQHDVRKPDYQNYEILLLQINSFQDYIMWGDGIANFFITPKDLENKDFSKVLYTWDCG